MSINVKYKIRRFNIFVISIIILIIFYIFCLPKPLFTDPTSTIIEDKNGELLAAKIADDGQWRFPHDEYVPERMKKSIVVFEDKYFYYHGGVNPFSLIRAFISNIRQKRIVSGGSTISMQVIRLSRKGKERSIKQKLIEMILATRLELSYSKDEILALYMSNAPFGGNVVGLDAASWRYFGRKPDDLSWGEAATLAVLPNSPSLIHPGKNRDLLLEKRNRLLDDLLIIGDIDSTTCYLSKLEALPDEPVTLPQITPHLLTQMYIHRKGRRIITTLDKNLQERCIDILQRHHNALKFNNINNASAIIVDVKKGNVLCYIGNVSDEEHEKNNCDVDVIQASRSSGSILKPVLYACMIDEGMILPGTLVPDVPTHFSGFTPKNFNLEYDGAVPAKRALARSLNIPAVKMLQEYGVPKFHFRLNQFGLTTVKRHPDHYGLSLILGGAETSLWELVGVYSSFSRILENYHVYNGKYSTEDMHMPVIDYNKTEEIVKGQKKDLQDEPPYLSAASIWQTYKSLLEVNRPEEEEGWRIFSSSRKIAWKTGTSFGFKDAWAIGTTPEYVVGVWVGNADGEGRPGIVGVMAAAPIMFELFNVLPRSGWFEQPYDEMVKIPVCRQSGYRCGPYCDQFDSIWIYEAGLTTSSCPYHTLVHVTPDEQYRVDRNCMSADEMVTESWFVLPPIMEYYYKSHHPEYRVLPPMHPDCLEMEGKSAMEFIYPKHEAKIYIPLDMDGTRGEVVFDIAHRKPQTTIFWHLDDEFIGSTRHIHQKAIVTGPGIHHIVLVDEFGEVLEKQFEIVGQKE
ncbi:MAG: penicillin-binding protein 1C [Bacteroidales bacterium]|nr:penicillin-binding protein 1C [Bacteroidales bacterium]